MQPCFQIATEPQSELWLQYRDLFAFLIVGFLLAEEGALLERRRAIKYDGRCQSYARPYRQKPECEEKNPQQPKEAGRMDRGRTPHNVFFSSGDIVSSFFLNMEFLSLLTDGSTFLSIFVSVVRETKWRAGSFHAQLPLRKILNFRISLL